jgi:hypothetical protein
MSLHDALREVAYGSEEEKEEREHYADQFASLIDSTRHPRVVGRRLIYALGAEASIALFALFKPGWLIELLAEYLLVLPFLTFGLGFFIAFSLYRMYEQAFDRGEKPVEVDRGVMSGYSGFDSRSRYYLIWFVAAAGAITNVILIALLSLLF